MSLCNLYINNKTNVKGKKKPLRENYVNFVFKGYIVILLFQKNKRP
jgi:hypothetical protein